MVCSPCVGQVALFVAFLHRWRCRGRPKPSFPPMCHSSLRRDLCEVGSGCARTCSSGSSHCTATVSCRRMWVVHMRRATLRSHCSLLSSSASALLRGPTAFVIPSNCLLHRVSYRRGLLPGTSIASPTSIQLNTGMLFWTLSFDVDKITYRS